jgi:hypothetical protein
MVTSLWFSPKASPVTCIASTASSSIAPPWLAVLCTSEEPFIGVFHCAYLGKLSISSPHFTEPYLYCTWDYSTYIIYVSVLCSPHRPRGGSSSSGRVKNFHFTMSSRPALGPTHPPRRWVSGALPLQWQSKEARAWSYKASINITIYLWPLLQDGTNP